MPIAISIICLLWLLLFSSFRPERGTTRRRALIWEGVHFPLYAGLLLLLAAIVVSQPHPTLWSPFPISALAQPEIIADPAQNVVRVLSFVGGIDIVSEEFSQMIHAIDTRQPLSPADWENMSTYLNRLPLAPR